MEKVPAYVLAYVSVLCALHEQTHDIGIMSPQTNGSQRKRNTVHIILLDSSS